MKFSPENKTLPTSFAIAISLGITLAFLFPAGADVKVSAQKTDKITVPSFIKIEKQLAASSLIIEQYFPVDAEKHTKQHIPAFTLHGLIQQEKQYSALITVGGKDNWSKSFCAGDSLDKGTKITKITEKSVTIKTKEGKENTLFLYPPFSDRQ